MMASIAIGPDVSLSLEAGIPEGFETPWEETGPANYQPNRPKVHWKKSTEELEYE